MQKTLSHMSIKKRGWDKTLAKSKRASAHENAEALFGLSADVRFGRCFSRARLHLMLAMNRQHGYSARAVPAEVTPSRPSKTKKRIQKKSLSC